VATYGEVKLNMNNRLRSAQAHRRSRLARTVPVLTEGVSDGLCNKILLS
jgi:hypothetical protein